MLYELIEKVAREHLRLVRVKSDYVSAACPFHKGGQERSPSFWIKRDTGSWGCFSCSEQGRFEELMKRLGIRNTKIQGLLQQARDDNKRSFEREKIKRTTKAKAKLAGTHTLPKTLLGVYDYLPVALIEDGFTEETLDMHKVGFDKINQRITYPIWDYLGRLIGISGRSIDGSEPKYKVYQGWHDDWKGNRVPGELGKWFESYSSTNIRDHLWRIQFVYKELYSGASTQLIVVEGYKAAMWVAQCGWTNVVALMGSRMSQAQERMIRKLGTETWILLDNNEAGQDGAEAMADRLGDASFPVYRCQYPRHCDETTQPDNLTEEELSSTLESAVRVVRKRHGKRWFVA